MEQTVIVPCSFRDIMEAKSFPDLVAEYAHESAIPELGGYSPQAEIYQLMENQGVMHSRMALIGDTMVGFVTVLLSVLPHFGRRTATVESLFVGKQYRSTGAGLLLLREARRLAREAKADGLFISAPIDSRLAEVMSKLDGYRETNRVFFRSLA